MELTSSRYRTFWKRDDTDQENQLKNHIQRTCTLVHTQHGTNQGESPQSNNQVDGWSRADPESWQGQVAEEESENVKKTEKARSAEQSNREFQERESENAGD